MKRRNLLLALFLLAAFAGLGVLYFRTYVVQKPFGVILFVGEGLVGSRLAAAQLYDGGADPALVLQKLPNLALLTTHSNDLAVSDAAAAASALATGHKVNQRALAVDPVGRPLRTLLEFARDRGRATGLVTTGCLTDPTPAAFYAHSTDFRARESSAVQLIEKAVPDLVFGGGANDFLPDLKGGRRKDSRDLVLEAAQKAGYSAVVRTAAELDGLSPYQPSKVFGLFAQEAFYYRDELDAQRTQPSLADMVRRAVEILQKKSGGYVLVVDAGLIGRASEHNEGERALQEIVELDRALGVALQYAGEKTLVVAAGTVSTGGMVLNGYPLRQDRGVALLGTNVYGLPSLTWATGPNGPDPAPAPGVVLPPPVEAGESGSVETTRPTKPADRRSVEPAAFTASSAANVADFAVATGFGPGSERLRGWQDNTFVYQLIKDQL